MKPTAPIRETVIRECRTCGDKLEDQATLRDICYACWLCNQIPNIRQYQKREEYHRDYYSTEEDRCRNATTLPATGIPFMDERRWVYWKTVIKLAALSDWRHQEQAEGLDNSEYDL